MNTQPTPISDRIVSQFRKGEATSDGLILTVVELELKIAAICRELDEARADTICWMSIAEGRGRTDDDDTGKAMSNLIRQRDEAREELTAVTEALQSPIEVELDMIRGKIAIPDRSEFEYIEQIKNLTAQRDRLAEALERIIEEDGVPMSMRASSSKSLAKQALQSLTPNQP